MHHNTMMQPARFSEYAIVDAEEMDIHLRLNLR